MKKQHAEEIASTLAEMRAEYWRGIEEGGETSRAETREYVVIRFAGERFGIPSELTREVLRLPRLVRVPRVPGHVLGVINLRGEIVAVTDLRPLLGLPVKELPSGARLVVAESGGLLTALAVEAIEGMRSIPVEDIEPFTEGLAGIPREIVAGQVLEDGGLLVLLDLAKVLSRPEFVIDQKRE